MEKRTNTATWSEKEQRWTVRVQRDGKRRAFHSSTPGRRGQREANAKADAWLDQGVIRGTTRVSVLAEEFILELKSRTTQAHWRQYESILRIHVLPAMGLKKIGSITELDLQQVINAAYQKGLAKKTLHNIKACLCALVKHARLGRATDLRPESLTIPAGAPSRGTAILQPQDLVTLMTVDTTIMHGRRVLESYINAYRFEALTGLRPGEVIAARWDWLKDGTLYIRGAINQWAEHTQGKNDNARRVYRLPVLAQEVLDGQRRLLEAQAIRSPYIFPNEIGMPILQATYYSRWVRYRDSNGLTQGTTPYGLRHTFFSACKPIPKPLLDPVAGHSPAMDTFGVYGHEMDGDLQYVADEIDSIFSRILASEQDMAPKVAPE